MLLTEIDPSAKDHIERILFRNGLADSQKPEIYDLIKDHMACPALPMCGLATTEAERITPQLLEIVDIARKAADLPNLPLVTRITGCPNGCARTYMAEIGFVGSGPL